MIAFLTMLFLIGMPMFYLEITIAQFSKFGPLDVWKVVRISNQTNQINMRNFLTSCFFLFEKVPAFRGLGICSLLLSGFIAFYYNVLICYSLIYAISSFIPTLPWTSCDFSWNNEKCCITKETSSFNATLSSLVSQACSPDTESPAKQYFK